MSEEKRKPCTLPRDLATQKLAYMSIGQKAYVPFYVLIVTGTEECYLNGNDIYTPFRSFPTLKDMDLHLSNMKMNGLLFVLKDIGGFQIWTYYAEIGGHKWEMEGPVYSHFIPVLEIHRDQLTKKDFNYGEGDH